MVQIAPEVSQHSRPLPCEAYERGQRYPRCRCRYLPSMQEEEEFYKLRPARDVALSLSSHTGCLLVIILLRTW